MPKHRRVSAWVAVRRIRNEIELLEGTQGSYFEIVANIKDVLREAGLKVLDSPDAGVEVGGKKLPPLSLEERAARAATLSKRGPRS